MHPEIPSIVCQWLFLFCTLEWEKVTSLLLPVSQ
jgi:hypothetical protein